MKPSDRSVASPSVPRKRRRRLPKLTHMAPREATSLTQAIRLQRDNISTANGWILIDDGSVIVAQQRSGEEAAGIVKFSRREFHRMIDWYNQKQRLTDD